jgi:hypothetical protein
MMAQAPSPSPPSDAVNEPYTGGGLAESIYDEMFQRIEPTEPIPDRKTMLSNIAAGNVTGLGRFAGSLLGLADQIDTWGSGLGRAKWRNADGEWDIGWQSPAEFDQYLKNTKGQTGVGRQVADWFKEPWWGYDASRLTDDPLGEIAKGNIGGALAWGFETGAASIVDMALAITTPWAYWGSLSDDMIQARVEANETVGPSTVDMAVGIVAAAAQAYLEKLGAEGILTAAVAKDFKKKALKTTLKQLLKAGGKAGIREAGTEAGQSVVEDIAGGVGTKKGIPPVGEMAKRAGEGALAGLVFGEVAGTAGAEVRRRQFLNNLEQAESGGDPNVKSTTSTAAGPFGFIDSTWLRMMKKIGIDDGSRTKKQLLALKKDPGISRRAAEAYAIENTDSLVNAGYEANEANLSLAHLLGGGEEGVLAVLGADPNTPLSDILPAHVIEANKKLMEGKTAGDLIAARGATAGGAIDTGRRRAGDERDEEDAEPVGLDEDEAGETALDKIVREDAEKASQERGDVEAGPSAAEVQNKLLAKALGAANMVEVQQQIEREADARDQDRRRASTRTAGVLPLANLAARQDDSALPARSKLKEISDTLLEMASRSVQRARSQDLKALIQEQRDAINAVGKASAVAKDDTYREARETAKDVTRKKGAIEKANERNAVAIGRMREAFNLIISGEGRRGDVIKVGKQFADLEQSLQDAATDSVAEVKAFMDAMQSDDLGDLTKAVAGLTAKIQETLDSADRSEDNPYQQSLIKAAERDERAFQEREADLKAARTRKTAKVKEAETALGAALKKAGIKPGPRKKSRLDRGGGQAVSESTLEYNRTAEEQAEFERISTESRRGTAPGGSEAHGAQPAKVDRILAMPTKTKDQRAARKAALKKLGSRSRELVLEEDTEQARTAEVQELQKKKAPTVFGPGGAEARRQVVAEKKEADVLLTKQVIAAGKKAAKKIDKAKASRDALTVEATRKAIARKIEVLKSKIAHIEQLPAGSPIRRKRQGSLEGFQAEIARLEAPPAVAEAPKSEVERGIESLQHDLAGIPIEIAAIQGTADKKIAALPATQDLFEKAAFLQGEAAAKVDALEARQVAIQGRITALTESGIDAALVDKASDASVINIESYLQNLIDKAEAAPPDTLFPIVPAKKIPLALARIKPRDKVEPAARKARRQMDRVRRRARAVAKATLQQFGVNHPEQHQALLEQGAVVGLPASKRHRGVRTVPIPVKGEKGKRGITIHVPGLVPSTRTPTGWMVHSSGRDIGAVSTINTMLEYHGLLKADPSLDPETAIDPEIRKILEKDQTSKDHDAKMLRAARTYNTALIDQLVEQAKKLGITPATTLLTPPKEPSRAEPKTKAEPEPRVFIRPAEDTDGPAFPDLPPAGSQLERAVERAGPAPDQARKPVATAWLAARRAAGNPLNEGEAGDLHQLETVDRLMAAYDAAGDDKGSFLVADGTGFGKTRPLLMSAMMIAEKSGKTSHIFVANDDIAVEFIEQAKAMGIDGTPEGILSGGQIQIHVTSHPNPKSLGIDMEDVGAVFVDEAQDFQNPGATGKQAYVKEIFRAAPFMVYATATPGDTVDHMIGLYAALSNTDPIEFAREQWGVGLAIGQGNANTWATGDLGYERVTKRMFEWLENFFRDGKAISRRYE